MHTTPVDTQKITVYIPKVLLQAAQRATGLGITETILLGLEQIVHNAQQKALDDLARLGQEFDAS